MSNATNRVDGIASPSHCAVRLATLTDKAFIMPHDDKATTPTVHTSGEWRNADAASIGDPSNCEDGKATAEQGAFFCLKAELRRAYAAPESCYEALTAADVIRRAAD